MQKSRTLQRGLESIDAAAKLDFEKAVSLRKEAVVLSAATTEALKEFYHDLDLLSATTEQKLGEHLAQATKGRDYPTEPTSSMVKTGVGPTEVMITVEYSGIRRIFFGLWKSKNFGLKATIYHGLERDELRLVLPVKKRADNAKQIARFLREVIENGTRRAQELAEKTPVYAMLSSSFESSLVSEVSGFLNDPAVIVYYVNCDTVKRIEQEYKQQGQQLIAKTTGRCNAIAESINKLDTKIKEIFDSIQPEITEVVQTAKTRITEKALEIDTKLSNERESRRAALRVELEKEEKKLRASIERDIESTRKSLQKEVADLRKEIDRIRSYKKSIPTTTKKMVDKLDRLFSDYDNRTNDDLDVDQILRNKLANELAEAMSDDPDITVEQVCYCLECCARNVRKSASEKFNASDASGIVSAVIYIIKNVQPSEIRWVAEKVRTVREYSYMPVDELLAVVKSFASK